MTNQCVLGAYWGPRKETIEQSAQRLQRFLWQLDEFGPPLDAWFEKGRSRREALLSQIDHNSIAGLETLVRKGQSRKDTTRDVIQELGFSVGLWNGQEDDRAISMRITCGLYWESQHSNVSLSNCFVLNLPDDLKDMDSVEKISTLLASVTKVWQPDRASVMSRAAMTARQFSGNKPFMDWMAYVPKHIESVEPPSSIRQIPGLGTIVISQNTPPAVTDQAAQTRITNLQNLLVPIRDHL